jgi:hypothetical protein
MEVIVDKVTRIYWTIKTSGAAWSGTDDLVTIRIFRDGYRLLLANVEPGNTTRLDQGELRTYYWEFKNPSNIGVAVSGKTVPYTEDFPYDVEGHLQCMFEIYGDDLWRVLDISSVVLTGEMKFIPGTIDAWDWVQTPKNFYFPGDDILSTDPSEGVRRLTLNY